MRDGGEFRETSYDIGRHVRGPRRAAWSNGVEDGHIDESLDLVSGLVAGMEQGRGVRHVGGDNGKDLFRAIGAGL